MNDVNLQNDQNQGDGSPRVANWVIMLIAVMVMLVALASVVGILFFIKNPNQQQYIISIVFLFFALSTASSLIFSQRISLSGTVHGVAVLIAGPAALWLICLYVFFRFIDPQGEVAADQPLITAEHILKESETKRGWMTYQDWQKKMAKTMDTLLNKKERESRNDLMRVTYNIVESENRITDARVSTVFFYFKKSKLILKFQRIRGRTENGGQSFIYFKASPSAEGQAQQRPKAAFLTGSISGGRLSVDTGILDTDASKNEGLGPTGYRYVEGTNIDAMTVAQYRDFFEDGDYMIVDMKRFSKDGMGAIDVGVFSADGALNNVESWSVARSIFADTKQVPLVFRKTEEQPADNVDELKEAINPWLSAIDEWLEEHGVADGNAQSSSTKAMFFEIRDVLRHDSENTDFQFKDLFSTDYDTGKAVNVDKTHGVTLVTFQWSSQDP